MPELNPEEAEWVMRAFASIHNRGTPGDTANARFAVCALLLAEVQATENERWEGMLPFLRSADVLVASLMAEHGVDA